MTEKLSDEAQREAERLWPLWLPTGDYEIDRENYDEQAATWQNVECEENRRAFILGIQWQSDRGAERIEALESEVERLNGAIVALREFTQEQHDEIRGRYDQTGGAPAEYIGYANACSDVLAILDGSDT